MTDKPDIAALVTELRRKAIEHSDFTKTAQARRTAEYFAHGDITADYRGMEPHDCVEWKAADELTRLSSLVQISDSMVERAKESLLSSDPSNFSYRVRAALTAALNEPTEEHIGYGIK